MPVESSYDALAQKTLLALDYVDQNFHGMFDFVVKVFFREIDIPVCSTLLHVMLNVQYNT